MYISESCDNNSVSIILIKMNSIEKIITYSFKGNFSIKIKKTGKH